MARFAVDAGIVHVAVAEDAGMTSVSVLLGIVQVAVADGAETL